MILNDLTNLYINFLFNLNYYIFFIKNIIQFSITYVFNMYFLLCYFVYRSTTYYNRFDSFSFMILMFFTLFLVTDIFFSNLLFSMKYSIFELYLYNTKNKLTLMKT